jgi:hypothetical protein
MISSGIQRPESTAAGNMNALRIAEVAFGLATKPTARPSSVNGSEPSNSTTAMASSLPIGASNEPLSAAVTAIATSTARA